MGVLVDETTRVMVQGITGKEGSFHARGCMAYGTNVVAGVTPGRGGAMFDEKVPVFNSVEEAVAETQANMALIFLFAYSEYFPYLILMFVYYMHLSYGK